jgi:hypothetical protein
LLISCGVKKNSKLTEVEKNLLMASYNEMRCSGEVKDNLSSFSNSILEKTPSLLKLQEKFLNIKGIMIDFSISSNVKETDQLWNSPLFLSEVAFKESWEKILKEGRLIKNPLWKAFLNNEEFKDQYFVTVNAIEVANILPKVNNLISEIQRYKAHSCAIDNLEFRRSEDIRGYLSLKEMSCESKKTKDCLENQLNSFHTLLKKTREDLEIKLISLCEKSEEKELCVAEFFAKKQKRKLVDYYQNYMNTFRRNKLDSLFGLEKNNRSFQCEKKDEVLELLIPFYAKNGAFSSYEQAYQQILRATEKYWSNDKFRIKFYDSQKSDKSVQVIRVGGVISRVNKRTPYYVELSEGLNGHLLSKTFAHELGHVFGFSDCYIEFYERENNRIVYYELDRKRKNLMCSLRFGSQIPDEYLAELTKKSCR